MRKKVLFFLERSYKNYVSGEKIATQLRISRMAVSKAVAALKREGAIIESQTAKGYMLKRSPDRLYPEAIAAHLSSSRIRDIHTHALIGSTNEEAKKLAAEGALHGTIVCAEEQSKGRGRYGREFFSPSDSGIYMSIILKPQELNDDILYTVAAAVAVRRVISRYNDHALIKWVNDIYIDEKKVCGILCEAVSELESGHIGSVICGVGINLTRPNGDFPEELKTKAGAVSDKQIKRAEIIAQLADTLLDVMDEDMDAVISEYEKYMMLCGREIFYSVNGERKFAKVIGVDNRGGLIVKDPYGNSETLRSGEVSLEKF